MITAIFLLATASGTGASGLSPDVRTVHNSIPSYCVDAETVRADIANGFTPDEQRYELPGAGWRVQQQHPNTALYASLKRIELEGRPPGTMCQYSSHVGVVYMRLYLDANIDPEQLCGTETCGPGPYWRAEWTESSPEQDRQGMEMIWVCTRENAAGLAVPSRACRFYLPPPGAPVPDVHGASGTTSETPPDDEAPW